MFSLALLFCVALLLPGTVPAAPILGQDVQAIDTQTDRAQRRVIILPEPASLALLGLGLTILAWRARRRRAWRNM